MPSPPVTWLYHGLLIIGFSLGFSCSSPDPKVIHVIPEARTTYLYDYGNAGNATDFLLSMDFKGKITEEFEVRLLLSREDKELTLAQAIELPDDRFEQLQTEPYLFKGRLQKKILDVEGQPIENDATYQAYVLVVEKSAPSNAMLSTPSKTLTLRDAVVHDIYTLTSKLQHYNSFLLDKKPPEIADFPPSVDMTFDSNDILLILTLSEGLMEFDGAGLKTIIPSASFEDPKVVRLGPEGFVYIIDGSSIVKYKRDGTFVETFMDNLVAPGSIAWDHFGQIYITEKIPDGRIMTFSKSKELIHSFTFTTAPITPKAVTYNRALKKIWINRTSVNGTGIVSLDPETQEWNLLGSLQFIGTFSDYFTTNAAGHTVIVQTDAEGGPIICVVENKLNQDLDVIEVSPPLEELPVSIALGPLQ